MKGGTYEYTTTHKLDIDARPQLCATMVYKPSAAIAAKLDAIMGTGNWSMRDEGFILVHTAMSKDQQLQIESLATYLGHDVTTMEIVDHCKPAVEPTETINVEGNGEAITAGLQVMIEQRHKGLSKYGVSIEDAPLSADQLCEHAQQEMADGLVYTSMLRKRIAEELVATRATIAAEIMAVVDDEARSLEMRMAIIRELVLPTAGATRCVTMFVQQSQLEEHNRINSNLLTLSRVRDPHAFKTPVKVIV